MMLLQLHGHYGKHHQQQEQPFGPGLGLGLGLDSLGFAALDELEPTHAEEVATAASGELDMNWLENTLATLEQEVF